LIWSTVSALLFKAADNSAAGSGCGMDGAAGMKAGWDVFRYVSIAPHRDEGGR
jgi:hypothetical protein